MLPTSITRPSEAPGRRSGTARNPISASTATAAPAHVASVRVYWVVGSAGATKVLRKKCQATGRDSTPDSETDARASECESTYEGIVTGAERPIASTPSNAGRPTTLIVRR